jgi:hypothetical protein
LRPPPFLYGAQKEPAMARKPNYNFERAERDRQKAAKKAEKLEAKRQRAQRKREGGETADDEAATTDD